MAQNRLRFPVYVCLGIAALVLCGFAGPHKDPFLGTWQLQPEKSTFKPGPAPDERSMIFEMTGDGLKHTTKTLNGFLGNSISIVYTAKFDGKDYPVTGAGIDTIALKRVDANTIERTGKVGGVQSETGTMKVSPDGKTLTVTINGAYRGTNYSSVQVLTRE